MDIETKITKELIDAPLPPPPMGALGAWVEFRGVVRGEEDGQPITAIEYDAYVPMAEREMQRLLRKRAAMRPCLAARVIHRVGIVRVGEAAVYVGIASRHRAEAFALLADFMDDLKRDVPIWKQRVIFNLDPVCADASQTLGSPYSPISELTGASLVPRSANPAPSDVAFEKPRAAATTTRRSSGVTASATEVMDLLRTLCQPLETERIPLAEAAGRVLRENLSAPEDQPSFDRSAVDGYAVRLDDSSACFHVVDEIRAGDWKPRTLLQGQTVRIATGGALPCDGLQVVMLENVRLENDTVVVLARTNERSIRFRGEDCKAGQELIRAGTLLSPGTLGLLAGMGFVQPLVSRLPRVLHVATGNEIVSPDRTPNRGRIRDANSTLVRAFLQQNGIVPKQLRTEEDRTQIKSGIEEAKSNTNLLLISGGASVGQHDFTRQLLEEAGFTIHVSKTTARPGKPLIVAQRGATLAFGLPGNPLAHFVCLNLYVRTALATWSGQSGNTGFLAGRLAKSFLVGGNARETFWPARLELRNGVASLTPLPWASSGDLTVLATANALIRLPHSITQMLRGSLVDFISTKGNA